MTKYYKSAFHGPALYVQEDGQWRGYLPGGVLQRSRGLIPEAIRAYATEITQTEGEALLSAWEASAPRTGQTSPVLSLNTSPDGELPIPAADPESRTVYSLASKPRSARLRWPYYVAAGSLIVIVAVVLAVLGGTGVLGGGSEDHPDDANTNVTGGTDDLPDDVVATIGLRSISRKELEKRVADFAAEFPGRVPDKKASPDQYKEFQEYVLDYLITLELVTRKAVESGIVVTDQDVQEQMDAILEITYGGDQAKFDAALEQEGLTMDQFKRRFKESTLFDRVYAEVTKDVTPSDSEAKRQEAWLQWIEQAKAQAGVVYGDGWKPVTTTTATTGG